MRPSLSRHRLLVFAAGAAVLTGLVLGSYLLGRLQHDISDVPQLDEFSGYRVTLHGTVESRVFLGSYIPCAAGRVLVVSHQELSVGQVVTVVGTLHREDGDDAVYPRTVQRMEIPAGVTLWVLVADTVAAP